MDDLIKEIYEIVKDYRADESDPGVRMTPDRIRQWIDQFNLEDQRFILAELKNIFSKQYYSKQKIKDFLKSIVEILSRDYGYENTEVFLEETVFLNLQETNKSQTVLLQLMGEVLQNEFHFSINDCGSRIKKNFIYIDDVLCTGNTVFKEAEKWVKQVDDIGERTHLEQLKNGSIRLLFVHVFSHKKNREKTRARFRYKIDENFNDFSQWYLIFEIESEIIMPTGTNQSELVTNDQQEIEARVDQYCRNQNFPVPEAEFYRSIGQPVAGQFFTSEANRNRFENIILEKGIMILRGTENISTSNLRALGYSLPSHKNFGFGALCFTWRNIPNNSPLVFWYSGGGFFPLFKVRRVERGVILS